MGNIIDKVNYVDVHIDFNDSKKSKFVINGNESDKEREISVEDLKLVANTFAEISIDMFNDIDKLYENKK